jgi:hypothetical protein
MHPAAPTVRVIDDLDGSEASGTFDFAINGRQYQIDLSDDNAAKLPDALAPYGGAARKAGKRRRPRAARQTVMADKPARSNRDETAAIRECPRERPRLLRSAEMLNMPTAASSASNSSVSARSWGRCS